MTRDRDDIRIKVGHKFGKYTVVHPLVGYKRGRPYWLCYCECGRFRPMREDAIEVGRQCICVTQEIRAASTRTHGRSSSKVYNTLRKMIDRCHNPRNTRFRDYGARGIAVCQEWRDSFEAFYAHVGDPPSSGHSINRIDNDRGYEPGNVRWATRREQQQNMRTSRLITHNGETLCVSEWARRVGLKPGTIRRRLDMGWPIPEVLEAPIERRPITHDGCTKSMAQWARDLGVTVNCIANRLRLGWTESQAVTIPTQRPTRRKRARNGA